MADKTIQSSLAYSHCQVDMNWTQLLTVYSIKYHISHTKNLCNRCLSSSYFLKISLVEFKGIQAHNTSAGNITKNPYK